MVTLSRRQKEKIRLLRTFLLQWGRRNGRDFLWRHRANPYHVLVAEFFLQRTNAEQVARQYNLFVRKYPNFISLEKISEKKVERFLSPLGLHKRVDMFIRLMKMVNREYKGKLPQDYDLLTKLPGVGDYGASAILLFAFRERRGLVDANTIRVFSSLFKKRIPRNEGKRSSFIKSCADYFSSLGRDPRRANWFLLDYGAHMLNSKYKLPKNRVDPL